MNNETDRVSYGQNKIRAIGNVFHNKRLWICVAITFLVVAGYVVFRPDMILTESDVSELDVGDVHLTVPKRFYFLADIRPNYGAVHMPDDISVRSRGPLYDVLMVDSNL